METKEVVALCALAFIVGEAQAVYRANRKLKKLHKEKTILLMKVNSLVGFVSEVADNADPVEAVAKFKNSYDFINLIDGI